MTCKVGVILVNTANLNSSDRCVTLSFLSARPRGVASAGYRRETLEKVGDPRSRGGKPRGRSFHGAVLNMHVWGSNFRPPVWAGRSQRVRGRRQPAWVGRSAKAARHGGVRRVILAPPDLGSSRAHTTRDAKSRRRSCPSP